MEENNFILVAIRPLAAKGNELLGDNWAEFWLYFHKSLTEKGLEAEGSSDVQLLFDFEQPFSAITGVYESLARAKNKFEWQDSFGPAPFQVIIHFAADDELASSMKSPDAPVWEHLLVEVPHISQDLYEQWGALHLGDLLPEHSFKKTEAGLYSLLFNDLSQVRRKRLFPYRELPVQGDLRPCFYCGMTSHKPSSCPSKFLTMATQGVHLLGSLPVGQISDLYYEAFAGRKRLVGLLASGVTPGQVRKDQLLRVFVSYFDLNRTFQLRFLWNASFTTTSTWEELGQPETVSVDSHSMHRGLDCLRVGQYSQAEEFFVDESRRPKGRQFYATIARAFIAMELDRDSDAIHFLESAVAMASSSNEKIYVSLLLSRFFLVVGDHWKAEHALDNIFSVQRDNDETLYRQVQLMVNSDFGGTWLQQLRGLILSNKELFLAALIDPLLLPVVGPVEDILFSRLEAQRQEALDNFSQAQAQCVEFSSWFDEEDSELGGLLEELSHIGERLNKDSYFDNLEVGHRAKNLLHACYRQQEEKVDSLQGDIEETEKSWEGYRRFWQAYPYKSFFKNFQEIMQGANNGLAEVGELAKQSMYGERYRKIQTVLEEIREDFASLKPMAVRMNWVKILFDGAKLFVRRLVLTEVILLLLVMFSVPILVFWLDGANANGLIDMVKNPWVQKQILLVVTVIIAPIIALGQTLWKMMEV